MILNRSFRSHICQTLFPAAVLALLFVAGACRPAPAQSAPLVTPSGLAAENGTRSPDPAVTPAAPSLTPEPLAARVNGEGIFLVDFQAELKRYRDAATEGTIPTETAAVVPPDSLDPDSQVVLDDLIGQELLAQAAFKAGQVIDDAQVNERLSQLSAQLGSPAALSDWMGRNGYTDASLRRSLRTALLAAWQRDQIAAAVPAAAEEVHARQILVRERATAELILEKLKAGEKFATLALKYDPLTGGDLGWFPRGYLTQAAVDQAAFEIQPGEFSGVIETPIGFHILQVIERDPQHTLAPDALRFMQDQALSRWIAEQRKQSQIEINLPAP
jgi:peptidyl-prolyl cis-trans isomerase C